MIYLYSISVRCTLGTSNLALHNTYIENVVSHCSIKGDSSSNVMLPHFRVLNKMPDDKGRQSLYITFALAKDTLHQQLMGPYNSNFQVGLENLQ